MRKYWWLAVLVAVLAAPAFSQEKPGTIARVFVTQVKPGMVQQYEEGRKRHMDWHRKQNDTWTWTVYQVVTGDAEGQYVVITEDHHWKDFDAWDAKMAAGDEADGAANLSPFTAGSTSSFYKFMADISRPPAGQSQPKMIEVLHFIVKQGSEPAFTGMMKKIDRAIKKTNWPVNYLWYELANGGEGPHYVLVIPHDNWASMEDPEVPFPAMLEKGLGKIEATAVLQGIGKTIQRQWSEMLQYRPELSYTPAGK